jgi:shikimate kinase/3-dehydroquinate synthase
MTDAPANLILSGPPGAGKSSLARALSHALKRELIDLDAAIETRLGHSIAELFQSGREAEFRQVEAELLSEISTRRGLIVALGGGALTPLASRALLSRSRLINITANPAKLLERLHSGPPRPLLLGPDSKLSESRLRALLSQRQGLYQSIPWQLDSDGAFEERSQALQSLVTKIEASPEVETLCGSVAGHGSAILIGERVLDTLPELLASRGLNQRPFVISNDRVWGALRSALPAAASSLGHAHRDGEEHKNASTLAEIYASCARAGLDRKGLILGFGGGVTTDLAGFVAATWHRGLPLIQAPTSLLAMVDAAVGGKTGYDLPEGKNLVGAFKQPELVLMDPRWLESLPPRQLACGAAEALKHGLIADPALFEALASGPRPGLFSAALLERIILVKLALVEEDPEERGARAHLNLGHTFGHAIERCSDYKTPHGEAVALGMLAACRLAATLDLCDPRLEVELRAALMAWSLPTKLAGLSSEQLMSATGSDKKRLAGQSRYIIPRAMGRVEVLTDPPSHALQAAWQAIGCIQNG